MENIENISQHPFQNLKDKVMTFEEFQEWECKQGHHNFVECDEWEATCSRCGKFQDH